ncbi:class I SAM-dependent methyltransferase [uncultured Rhodoblastus sp.]|uniref:class I SAM-dependent methyltransferase n=1 Tax=uncultured Rhodoblastus sp. TaxID=543037 RepID=UPI0025D463B7|nr:class I SAM-dependent methyltransferase [uncultured Rhodoblastus sp.]
MPTIYDRVRYPNWPNTRTHPARTGALAQLLGRKCAPFTRCRVLEIACSEGVNIASMAVGAPNSEFIGIDIAESAIARGAETIRSARLDNLKLRLADIRDEQAVEGEFDYIIAHGVYSWVAADVRAALLAMIGKKLSANGLAFISYNVFPGCRVRETIRDYLRYALRDIADPQERMAAARSALEYQMSGWSDDKPFQKALIEAAENNLERPIEVLFHDEMGEVWEPQFLTDVCAAARAQGLEYLADAHPSVLNDGLFPSVRFDAARKQTGGDWVKFEQLLDFTDMRPFRWSLFCRKAEKIERIATPDRVVGLYASADLTAAPGPGKKAFAFREKSGVEFETDDEKLGGLLDGLTREPAVQLDDYAAFPEAVEALLRLYVNSAVTLSTQPPIFTLTPAEKPLASPLARAQARRGEAVLAALNHKPVRMEDPFWNVFLQQLDGTHTHEDLAQFLLAQAGKTIEEARRMMPDALREVAGNRLLMR